MKMTRLDARSFALPATLVAALITLFQLQSQAQEANWVAQDTIWKYYQDGEPPEDEDFWEWYEPDYDDTAWSLGAAELGFDTSQNSETTTLTRGEVTYYFRTTFNVSSQAQLDLANQLLVTLVRDDGAVVYVNGRELFRDNMNGFPGDPVDHDELAVLSVAGDAETEEFERRFLSNLELNVGVNTVAVEVHQSTTGSSDISFSLKMEGFSFVPTLGDYTPPAPLAFNNSFRGDTQYSYLSNTNKDFEIGWFLRRSGDDATQLHFTHPDLEVPSSFADGVALHVSGGDAVLRTDVAGTTHIDADVAGAYRINISNYTDVAVQFGLRGFDDAENGGFPGMGGTGTRARVWIETSSTGVDGDFAGAVDPVLDLSAGETSGLIDLLVEESTPRKVMVPTNGSLGSTWQNVGFNDNNSLWTSGVKGAGYERSSGYDPFLGPTLDLESKLYSKNSTLYMRVPFNVTDKDEYVALSLSMHYDDGFVAYINGQEVVRANGTGTPPAYNASASTTNADDRARVWENFGISDHLDKLVNGNNVLAIHGLNRPSTSSDMLISPELKAIKDNGGAGGPVTGEPESIDDISSTDPNRNDADPANDFKEGPFTYFRYEVEDSAQTVRLRFDIDCRSGDDAIILDNILVTGTPLTVKSYSDWIALTTDFDIDDEGHPSADPDGDTIPNLIEYAFGGSATEPNERITPTSEVIDVNGAEFLALTWRQFNLSYSGSLDRLGGGGFEVQDVKYIPQFSRDGINWEDGENGPTTAVLLDEIDGVGEFVDVTAYYFNAVSTAPRTERLFGRIKVKLIE